MLARLHDLKDVKWLADKRTVVSRRADTHLVHELPCLLNGLLVDDELAGAGRDGFGESALQARENRREARHARRTARAQAVGHAGAGATGHWAHGSLLERRVVEVRGRQSERRKPFLA